MYPIEGVAYVGSKIVLVVFLWIGRKYSASRVDALYSNTTNTNSNDSSISSFLNLGRRWVS